LSRKICTPEGSRRLFFIFLVHIPDPFTPLEETAQALDDIVIKGWVRYVGFSNYPAWKAQKMLAVQEKFNRVKWIGAQMYYSLLGRDEIVTTALGI